MAEEQRLFKLDDRHTTMKKYTKIKTTEMNPALKRKTTLRKEEEILNQNRTVKALKKIMKWK
ncbi:hypothetical protein HHI36_019118, partial [Cryptolaemus montrouzieri]